MPCVHNPDIPPEALAESAAACGVAGDAALTPAIPGTEHSTVSQNVTRWRDRVPSLSGRAHVRSHKRVGLFWEAKRASLCELRSLHSCPVNLSQLLCSLSSCLLSPSSLTMPVINAPAPRVNFFTPAQYPPSGTAVDNGKPIPSLFQPLKIRGVEFQNRIWVSVTLGHPYSKLRILVTQYPHRAP